MAVQKETDKLEIIYVHEIGAFRDGLYVGFTDEEMNEINQAFSKIVRAPVDGKLF